VVHSSTTNGRQGGRVRPAPSGASVPAVLVDQHRRLRELLAEVGSGAGADRRRSFERFRRLLAAHETAEEMVVRPVSAQIMDRDAVAERNHEERRIVQLLAVMEKLDASDSGFEELLPAFAEALDAHLTLEETSEFPILEAELSEHDRAAMARWIARTLAFGPTHAHPGAFGSPMFQRVVTPFNALVDHARDAYERTRQR
jgi:hemerythrin superfamily protein